LHGHSLAGEKKQAKSGQKSGAMMGGDPGAAQYRTPGALLRGRWRRRTVGELVFQLRDPGLCILEFPGKIHRLLKQLVLLAMLVHHKGEQTEGEEREDHDGVQMDGERFHDRSRTLA
jgi:hypothetical protein